MRRFLLIILLAGGFVVLVTGCPGVGVCGEKENPYMLVLGITQDGGYPHAGCKKTCCAPAWKGWEKPRHVSCLAIVDPVTSQRWIIDATPDFPRQLRMLDELFPVTGSPGIDGIFLTHAHMGHYTGLMHLGREVMGTSDVPVYAMPLMFKHLETNGPWELLVRLNNISLKELQDGIPVQLNDRLTITPFMVPHREEYTETVGFRIDGPERSAIYISDIDKWYLWDQSIVEWISRVSVAYLDASFYADGEIKDRSMAEIPHPFIQESMELFQPLSLSEKSKIRFIHLNHTNPALLPDSDERKHIINAGYRVAEELEIFDL